MPNFLYFDSSDDKNPFIQIADSIFCIEENSDKTLTYWFADFPTSEIKSQKTLSSYQTFKELELYLSLNKFHIMKIETSDNLITYIKHDYYKVDNNNKPILPSGIVLGNTKTKLL